MTLLEAGAVMLAIMAVSAALTGVARAYAVRRALLDVPGARSSHATATPRGGGMAIVVTLTLAQCLATSLGEAPWWPWPVVVAAAALAILGFVDDHGGVSAPRRLVGHVAVAVTAWWAMGGVPPLVIGSVPMPAWCTQPVAVIAIIWFINFTNFMDGIDGIASAQTVATSLGVVLILVTAGVPGAVWPALVLATATLGFLWWNWPPASIFMGDVASGYLGLLSATLVLATGWLVPDGMWAALLLHGMFVVDATVTLVRRMWNRERVFDAHRSHAYQMLSRWWRAHLPVTALYGAVTVAWLWPWAWAVAAGRVTGVTGLAIAWAPLVGAAVWLQFRRYTFPA